MKFPDIAEVARLSGIAASRLRYYEERGLISSVGRRGLRRTFAPSVYSQLALISLGQEAGFSLQDIAQMIGSAGQPQIDRALLAARADQIDRSIAKLAALRDGLHHAAACPQALHTDCPTFQRLLKVASGKARRRRKNASDTIPLPCR